MNALKKPKATQCSDHCTISLIIHTQKTVARVLIRIERKIVDALGEDQFGFTRGKGIRDTTGMLSIILE